MHRQAHELLLKDRCRFITYVDDTSKKSIDAVLKAADSALQRAYASKYETLCARALLTSKNKADRVNGYISEYTRVSKKDAGKTFYPKLWAKIDDMLKPPSKAKPAAGGAAGSSGGKK